jgi:phosphatidylserine/phosphatidylglycerophosphate/cardiolipin synthase-like enzyme
VLKIRNILPLALLLAGCSTSKPQMVETHSEYVNRNTASQEFSAMFSPWEGTEAFGKMFNAISKANHSVKVTVYSWSAADFDKSLIAAATNNADVKVVLHGPLGRDAAMLERVKKLELLKFPKGKISFKIAPRNMHEKFILVDGETLINSSANMSNGAKTKYSENFVFLTGPAHILENFENEFAVLWNSSSDVLSDDKDVVEDRLPYNADKHHTAGKDIALYSSSMNYHYPENATSSAAYKTGKFIKLAPKGGGEGPWTVRDAIIKAIDSANKNIYCSFNHFNIKDVAEALVAASKRGVDVKLTVDNQEFKEFVNDRSIEMTPRFVEGWKKISGNASKEAPVRVKFYSHYPNPALWLLNHHKFLLIDYDKNGGTDTSVLFTGSYNLSATAEHKQFDNMVTFTGKKYQTLQESFLGEFDKLWDLERKNDKPNAEILEFFTTVNDDTLPMHNNRAVSLSWSEITALRNQIKKTEPAFLKGLNMMTSSCRGFNIKTKKLVGCK